MSEPNYGNLHSSMNDIVEQAARYRAALLAIRAVCEHAVFGGWRHTIAAIVDSALKR